MKACFIGLGYIGLPTAIIASCNGVEVLGVDINEDIVEKTNAGKLHFIEPGMEDMLGSALASGHFRASCSPEESDAFFIVVPTPFKENMEPDLSYVEQATKSVIPYLREGNLFVIESTSPVGTTERMADLIYSVRPELKGKIHIAYCPERVLPGNVIYELTHNDRVVGGITPESTEAAAKFYSLFVKGEIHHTDSATAEMCKLTENASRDVQIAFANELSMICDKAGINVWELIELANRHPRVNILRPGCGVGGHCIAVDPYFIKWAFPEESRIISAAREVNNYKSSWCAEKIMNTILRFRIDHKRRPTVALMGLSFKPDIDDLRESPALEITRKVTAATNDADYLVCEPNLESLEGFRLSDYREAFDKADIVVFLTAHRQFFTHPSDSGKIILDFCGVFKCSCNR